MPPLIQLNSSSKLDSKSNTQRQTNEHRTSLETYNPGEADEGLMRPKGGWERRQLKQRWASCLLQELLPLGARYLTPGSARLTVEPPSFEGPNWQRVGDQTLIRTWQEENGRSSTHWGLQGKARFKGIYQSCRKPVRDRAARNGEERVPGRDRRRRTASHSQAKQGKALGTTHLPNPIRCTTAIQAG